MLGCRTQGALKDETARLPIGWFGGFVLSCALLSGGCSAISATLACRQAERAVRQGAVATPDGTPRGVYQLTLARAYLEKAREEAAEAHYGSASKLAEAARLASARASSQASAQGRTE